VGASAGPSVSGGGQRSNRTPASRAIPGASRLRSERFTKITRVGIGVIFVDVDLTSYASDDLRVRERVCSSFSLSLSFFPARGRCIPARDPEEDDDRNGEEAAASLS